MIDHIDNAADRSAIRRPKEPRELAELETAAAELRRRLGLAAREERRRQNIRQADLAHATQLAQSFISDVENGTRNASWVSLLAICKALHISLAQLYIRSELKGRKLSRDHERAVNLVCELIAQD